MWKNRIGDVTVVENKNPHRLAKPTYNHIRIQLPDGKETAMLLTDKELQKGIERAAKNPEDLVNAGWLQDKID